MTSQTPKDLKDVVAVTIPAETLPSLQDTEPGKLITLPPVFTLDQAQLHRDYVETFTGRQFWLPDFNPDDIVIEDIAHHLAQICRFGGACRRHYSVAEHSVLVQELTARMGAPLPVQLGALLHDAGEAYCGDICRPLKFLAGRLREIEHAIEAATFAKFGAEENPIIHGADNVLLASEARVLMATGGKAWGGLPLPADEEMVSILQYRFEMRRDWCHPEWGEQEFLRRFGQLRRAMGVHA